MLLAEVSACTCFCAFIVTELEYGLSEPQSLCLRNVTCVTIVCCKLLSKSKTRSSNSTKSIFVHGNITLWFLFVCLSTSNVTPCMWTLLVSTIIATFRYPYICLICARNDQKAGP